MEEFIYFNDARQLLNNNSNSDSHTLLIELVEAFFKEELSFYLNFDNEYGFKCTRSNISSDYLKDCLESPFSYLSRESKIVFQDRKIGINYKFPHYDNEEKEVYMLAGYYKLDLMDAYPRIKEILAARLSENYNRTAEIEVLEPINRVVSQAGQVWSICSTSKDIPTTEEPYNYIKNIYPQFDDVFLVLKEFNAYLARKNIKVSIKKQRSSDDSLCSSKRPGRAEAYAKNREEVLGAALSVLAQYRNQCVTSSGKIKGAKIAKLIEDKAKLFWPSTHVPPLERESIPKLINDWLKKTDN